MKRPSSVWNNYQTHNGEKLIKETKFHPKSTEI